MWLALEEKLTRGENAMKRIVTRLALILLPLACSGSEPPGDADESGFVTTAQELRHGDGGWGHARHRRRAIEISYSYSFNGVSGSTSLRRGQSFTVWDDVGGCGVESRDIAVCESDRHASKPRFAKIPTSPLCLDNPRAKPR